MADDIHLRPMMTWTCSKFEPVDDPRHNMQWVKCRFASTENTMGCHQDFASSEERYHMALLRARQLAIERIGLAR